MTLFACWLVVRRLLDRAGTASDLFALGARPLDPGDLEERQLVNVVEEIALAAGLPPPSVHLIDSDVANAAAVGSSPSDAAIVVSRGLLATLGRDETQGVIAHLVARVGNGDLGMTRTIASLYITLGLVSGVLSAPRDRSARRTLGSVLGLAVRPRAARRHPERVAAASLALLRAQVSGGDDSGSTTDSTFRDVLFLPVAGAELAFSMNQMIMSWLLVTPPLKRAWRARSELADAYAVQLTRNPDGIAKGLAQLSVQGGLIPGTEAMAHLFVVGGEAEELRDARRQEVRRAEVQKQVAGRRGADRIRAMATAAAAQQHAAGTEQRASAGRGQSPLVGFQPRLGHRLDRLAALGSTVVFDDPRPRAGPLARVLLVLVGGPFVLLFLIFMIGICIAATGVAFALYMLFFVGPVLALHGVLRAGGS